MDFAGDYFDQRIDWIQPRFPAQCICYGQKSAYHHCRSGKCTDRRVASAKIVAGKRSDWLWDCSGRMDACVRNHCLIRIADDLPIVSTVNRLLGLIFGAVSGLFIVWTILAILGGVQEYSWAVQIVKAAKANSVVMWLQSYSPIMIILQMLDFPVI